MSFIATLCVETNRGGPAACAAPAGSRSDKKPRHARWIVSDTAVWCPRRSESIGRPIGSINAEWQLKPHGAASCRWRDPAALAGRPGHPVFDVV